MFFRILVAVAVLVVDTSGKEIPTVNNTLACGPDQPVLVTEKLGILTSPKFDNFHLYPANKNCSWLIKAPKGKVIQLQKMYFALNLDCNKDALRIFEGEPPNHKQTGQFCGYWAPSMLISKSNILYLNFISGKAPRNVGFSFFFKHTLPIVQCTRGEFKCRHRTKCVGRNKVCDGFDDCGDGSDEENCDNYAESAECGVPKITPVVKDDRIVGGRNAVPGSWPWQASLRLLYNEPFGHMCGGVLIHRQWLLTAGHCFKNDNLNVQVWHVVFGKHHLLIPDDTEQLRYMKEIYIHPGYQGLNETRFSIPWLVRKQHDLALVKLNAPVTITDYISPVCLPDSNHLLDPGRKCYVTGWGETYGTGFELELKQAAVPVVSLEKCREWHRFFNVSSSMLCAGYAEGGHDSCQGDSGGPLVYYEGNKWHLAAIVSTGGSICAEKEQPGIYTMVSYYLDWIKNVTGINTVDTEPFLLF